MPTQVLQDIRVLELGQLIAGPFAAKTLADFGAQVIKIEPPGQGDPLRKWRMLHGMSDTGRHSILRSHIRRCFSGLFW